MTETPYDRPSDPAKRHSAALTDGADRAPARAMLKATGLNDADLEKPLIAVANTWTDATPCNLHLRELGAKVKEGIRAAGGTPIAPHSPTPLTPIGLWVHAVTWLPTLKLGRSAARGMQ